MARRRKTPEAPAALASPPLSTPWVPLWPLAPATAQGLRTIYDSGALAAAAANIDIASIPQTFTNLRLYALLRSDSAGSVQAIQIRLNNDSGANYSWQNLVTAAASNSPSESIGATSARFGRCPAASALAGSFASTVLDIPWYAGVAAPKAGTGQTMSREGSGSGSTVLEANVWAWHAAAQAITRLTVFPLSGNWVAGSRVILYGLDATQVALPTVNPTYGTTLPASPLDGQEHVLVDSLANPTYQWRFRYNANSSSPYKWEFVGGAPANVAIAAAEQTASASFVDLATPGPLFALPRAGDYDLEYGAEMYSSAAGTSMFVSPKKAAATTLDIEAATGLSQSAALNTMTPSRTLRVTGMAAGDVIKLQYHVGNSGTATFRARWLQVRPVRVA